MTKSFVLGFALGLALLLVAGVGASRIGQKDAEQAKQRAELAAYQAELVDARHVQVGVLSETQRVHSRLFAHYRQLYNGRTISEAIEQAKGHTRILGLNVGLGLGPEFIKPESPESFFAELARASDAVIRGRVKNRTPYITEDEEFILTDYDILVSEILKDNVITPIAIGGNITFVQPGGKVALDGMIVKATDDAFSPLPKSNNDVVLFMKFIQQSGSYKATRYNGSFELEGSSLRPLTKERFPEGVLQDAQSFLQTARAVSKR
jgi:hypothetical protein